MYHFSIRTKRGDLVLKAMNAFAGKKPIPTADRFLLQLRHGHTEGTEAAARHLASEIGAEWDLVQDHHRFTIRAEGKHRLCLSQCADGTIVKVASSIPSVLAAQLEQLQRMSPEMPIHFGETQRMTIQAAIDQLALESATVELPAH